ncbi:uncharacterized protein UMAG_11159 [Mycosarcoma maydis]|uniref:Uncharacterized protein n=1 Tax=Mycosarcoma maydis TaxID=5270 RepID=A0A0D1BZ70_MYCMD|nr:uncharacterized protein UMAG_11159 [Ustilago maydis 521]KIS67037.1 hypothetical protein UMAG_11159 [Ustilago maydis 521]|eukprot:XP_011391361.1 hypothetical protein UMAG_11159 [Ustilago maydis 521]
MQERICSNQNSPRSLLCMNLCLRLMLRRLRTCTRKFFFFFFFFFFLALHPAFPFRRVGPRRKSSTEQHAPSDPQTSLSDRAPDDLARAKISGKGPSSDVGLCHAEVGKVGRECFGVHITYLPSMIQKHKCSIYMQTFL